MRYVLPGAEPKTDWDIGKREIERDHLGYFLDSHRRATGEEIEIVAESDTPDFIGRDADGNSVGIELTQVRFSPAERYMRRIFPPEAHDFDAFMEVLALMHKKDRTVRRGNWHLCKRRILVIVLIDTDLHAMATGTETDRPEAASTRSGWRMGPRSRSSAAWICSPSSIRPPPASMTWQAATANRTAEGGEGAGNL